MITEQLEWLADPERSDHEEIEEFLTQMMEQSGLSSEAKSRITERISRAVAERVDAAHYLGDGSQEGVGQ